ncbi:MAG: tRNA (cytidine(56)-2'-O)-methyltransferase [Acidilobaceae archaeon]|nr:tRNA (cytidine(56)-2'-O)-methyltransferase [Acidilobaceae archaeon]MCX8165707.1 tRNA (cytidine(56)-2'-O)-methyltransferase [Acidilobaceae archaeon]MDW7974132.1 tRNA methyltransferase [Sulfolobales archaeon]
MSAFNPSELYHKVYVLRLGHRPSRDKRVTTHVALVARAFGANGFVLETCDDKVLGSLHKVLKMWGGKMHIECGVDGLKYASSWDGDTIHLTMYGIPVERVIENIASSPKPKLVVVGSERVRREFYEIAQYNVAIGNQPHSEVSALAIFLDRLYRGQWSSIRYENARLRIVPSERGKRVVRVDG